MIENISDVQIILLLKWIIKAQLGRFHYKELLNKTFITLHQVIKSMINFMAKSKRTAARIVRRNSERDI